MLPLQCWVGRCRDSRRSGCGAGCNHRWCGGWDCRRWGRLAGHYPIRLLVCRPDARQERDLLRWAMNSVRPSMAAPGWAKCSRPRRTQSGRLLQYLASRPNLDGHTSRVMACSHQTQDPAHQRGHTITHTITPNPWHPTPQYRSSSRMIAAQSLRWRMQRPSPWFSARKAIASYLLVRDMHSWEDGGGVVRTTCGHPTARAGAHARRCSAA